MRVLIAVLAVAGVATVAGCGDSSCSTTQFFNAHKDSAAVGSLIEVTTANCSTCEDSELSVSWQTGSGAAISGTIDIDLVPQCFVHNVMLTPAASSTDSSGSGSFVYSFNSKNCGDQIDNYVSATNNSTLPLPTFSLQVKCKEYKAPAK
jgi:hypothetical protein